MIYIHRHQEVRLIAYDRKLGEATVRRVSDGKIRVYAVGLLTATGGQPEIQRALKQLQWNERREEV